MNLGFIATAAEGASNPGFFIEIGGFVWAMFGVILAIMLAGIGSARGVMYVGSAATGLLSEEPKRFAPCLVLELLPSTQGIYGFVIAFLFLNKATEIGVGTMTIQQGLTILAAALPVGVIGLISGMCQGKVAASGIAMVAKKPKDWSKAVILTLTVELFALFGFLVSILMYTKM